MTETHGIITANGGRWFLAKPDRAARSCRRSRASWSTTRATICPPGPTPSACCACAAPSSSRATSTGPRPRPTPSATGWLNTGDIARIDDDGFVFIVDRAKDMVLRGGENVYCSEVETAIYHHDAVAEAAVFGIPDERLGEEVAAVIVLVPGHD